MFGSLEGEVEQASAYFTQDNIQPPHPYPIPLYVNRPRLFISEARKWERGKGKGREAW